MAGRRMLRVRKAFEVSLSHKFNGNFGGVVANPASKWCLNAWMANSALLRRCNPLVLVENLRFGCPCIQAGFLMPRCLAVELLV